MFVQFIDSPLGAIKISASPLGISEILFSDTPGQNAPSPLTEQAAQQLQAYFNGSLRQFNLPLAACGTSFQQQVWQALSALPFGTTCSYADIAGRIGNNKAVRAVGAANGRNPIAIVVPCHRVIGANGTLTGYAGGLDKKAWLLQHEQRQQALF
ncbi:MAG: methylated-DNA--[protein]-cysteine S-methyltransferase [Gammaproteobacteria bacterium]|nr:methylated-DNA--[protein]-cysteine S-methyltransferase [Gammaproteobacteria bacterium]MBU1553181.1 methylated-DNA--[protein]-cysteine S-methyltransferase [Gammaproteobacteria bacterium]MBU2071428.1 methylated-DNA--[protein]-cysteine S-methyltransferase [Gammaproteobacteria bacterium]MBU2182440.1 methylated-DNA--[protein]-cysteine S-methyltransferase [Gammaproteobacteria bacterium]MBU2204178.1 methylated-DNA--[protein]-cysteine S-methyltransferase [Gammaproteobacteria bacterium]